MQQQFSEEDLRLLAREHPDIARQLIEKMQAELEEDAEPQYMVDMFPEQRRFVIDDSPKKTALCSRRAGKSFGDAVVLLETARKFPNERSVYVALSRATARRIMWTTFERIERRYKLGLRFREIDNQLYVQHPNGHLIWLAGCKDSSEIEKFRGDYYACVIVDEAASFGAYLRELIEDVFEPALLDLQGQMVMSGTPGPIPAGPFYWATTGDSGSAGWRKWSNHYWTILQNPYIPHAPAWLAEKRIANNWDDTHPTYKREWLGIWVKDPGSMVYPYGPQNIFLELPDHDSPAWRWAIGIDVGYEDSSAFVVAGFRQGIPGIYIPEVFKKNHLIPSAVAAQTEKMMQKYKTRRVVIDSGGLGKGYQEEMLQRYGIVAESAKKSKKRAYIEIVRGEILSGNIKVHPRGGSDLLDEWGRLVWDEEHKEPDDRFEQHCFVAGTTVETESGPRSIETMQAGDLVVTRSGLRRVVASARTGTQRVWELETEAGSILGTGNHPMWTNEEGFIRLDSLTPEHTLLAWNSQRSSSLMGSGTGAIRGQSGASCGSTSCPMVGNGCTERSTKRLTAQSRLGVWFTTATATLSTIVSKTWKQWMLLSTPESTRLSRDDSLPPGAPSRLPGPMPPSGIGHQPDCDFTRNSGDECGRVSSRLRSPASSAAKHSHPAARQPFADRAALLNSAASAGRMTSTSGAPTAENHSGPTSTPGGSFVPARVLRVTRTPNFSAVFNLSVEEAEEYVAGGVLVHNCSDGALYVIRDIHTGNNPQEEDEALSPQEREQRRMDTYKSKLRLQLQKRARGKKAQQETLRAILAGL